VLRRTDECKRSPEVTERNKFHNFFFSGNIARRIKQTMVCLNLHHEWQKWEIYTNLHQRTASQKAVQEI